MEQQHKPCSFCKRAGIWPFPYGARATGAYRSDKIEINAKGDFYQPVIPFNGYLCDMHANDIDWVKLSNWVKEKPEFKHGEFDNGLHWQEAGA